MYCACCGTQNDDNAWKCLSCGSVLARPGDAPVYHQQVVAKPPGSGLAIASFVLSLVGIVSCGVASIVGLVLGIVALRDIDASEGQVGGRGMAVAGIWISAITMAGWVIGLVLHLALMALWWPWIRMVTPGQ